jgi:DNA-binding beta-propeller fold protein YncE
VANEDYNQQMCAGLPICSDPVSVISDSNDTVVTTIGVGSGPAWLAYDSSKGEVMVALSYDALSVISDSTDAVVQNLNVAIGPLVYDFLRGELFVSDASGSTVSVLTDASIASGSSATSTAPEFPSSSLAVVALVLVTVVAVASQRSLSKRPVYP